MTNPSSSPGSGSSRLVMARGCAIAAAAVGLVLIFYYVVPGIVVPPAPELIGMLVIVGTVGLLSLVAAIGYWRAKSWGWYVHLASVLGQLLFPGSLFEFKPDLYHLIAWISPVISLAALILMRIFMRRT